MWLNKQDSNSKESTKKRGGKRERSSKEVDEEEEPKGYIHVRARRGQATDSHSLAERVLRTIACKFSPSSFLLTCGFVLLSVVVWASFCSFCWGIFLQVRRERISERMRMLQALVPGCDKVNFANHQINCLLQN